MSGSGVHASKAQTPMQRSSTRCPAGIGNRVRRNVRGREAAHRRSLRPQTPADESQPSVDAPCLEVGLGGLPTESALPRFPCRASESTVLFGGYWFLLESESTDKNRRWHRAQGGHHARRRPARLSPRPENAASGPTEASVCPVLALPHRRRDQPRW